MIIRITIMVFLLSNQIIMAIDLKVLAIEHPPYISEKMENKGLSFDILNEVFKKSEYNIVPVILPSRRAQKEIAKYPVSLFSFPDIASMNNYKQVHIQNVIYTFYFNKDYGEITWNSLSDLKGKIFGELHYTYDSVYIEDELCDKGLIRKRTDSLEHLFHMLKKGRIDLVLSVELTAEATIKKLYPENDSIMQTEKKYLVIKGGPWFNLNLPETEKVMKYYISRIKEMKQDGSLLKIFERYYGEGKVPSNTIVD